MPVQVTACQTRPYRVSTTPYKYVCIYHLYNLRIHILICSLEEGPCHVDNNPHSVKEHIILKFQKKLHNSSSYLCLTFYVVMVK